MSTLEWIQLAIIIVAIIALSVYTIVKGIKEKWISKLSDTVKESIAKAEEIYKDGHGDEKKSYVIDAIKQKCKELGIPYELLEKLVSKLIDKIVEHYNVIAKHE